ncbi:hypothetical protein O181_015652 [Austropuccinia psidii MF-1]|uniref:Uncharacterized protein n=1 Tax=Austropuccinia psidii MF-1 TaxID=1389203 RepID=A0A9Q3C435_9BASI|nr:hypothetical protein [Austropuccinia psidii MF-1]
MTFGDLEMHFIPEPTSPKVFEALDKNECSKRIQTNLAKRSTNLSGFVRQGNTHRPNVGKLRNGKTSTNLHRPPKQSLIRPLTHTHKIQSGPQLAGRTKKKGGELTKEKLTNSTPPQTTSSQRCKHITSMIKEYTGIQEKWVTQNSYCKKPWWNTELLNPLVKARNAARQEMLKYKTTETKLKNPSVQKLRN